MEVWSTASIFEVDIGLKWFEHISCIHSLSGCIIDVLMKSKLVCLLCKGGPCFPALSICSLLGRLGKSSETHFGHFPLVMSTTPKHSSQMARAVRLPCRGAILQFLHVSSLLYSSQRHRCNFSFEGYNELWPSLRGNGEPLISKPKHRHRVPKSFAFPRWRDIWKEEPGRFEIFKTDCQSIATFQYISQEPPSPNPIC